MRETRYGEKQREQTVRLDPVGETVSETVRERDSVRDTQ